LKQENKSPERAKQPVPPLQGLPQRTDYIPGFRYAPPWALLFRAFSATILNLTPMLFRAEAKIAVKKKNYAALGDLLKPKETIHA
jgi:hypothetical protein